jgi:phosphatidylserine/phosphatidylglycerophosphate/cardiolipin synthase-like enzyme
VNAIQLDDLMDDTLIAYINRADKTIDLAIYSFGTQNISNIAAALNAAHNRGVDVRVVYCGTTANQGIQSLYPAIGKMESPTSSEYAIMHNKFIIIDAHHTDPNRAIVWTGSMNWTETCINNFPNNVVIVQDQSLAKGYTLEFEEMFGSTGLLPDTSQSRFGPYKTNNTPHEYVIGGRRVKSFFSPSDGVNAEIIRHIESAQHQVFVNTVLITRSDIAYALRDQHLAQKDVKVLVNNDGDCTQLVVDVLGTNLGTNFREYGESHILHHKLMMIDPLTPGPGTGVWTGSHNWSNAADQRNDENTLVIYDTTIANIYYQEFMKRWSLAIPLATHNLAEQNLQLHLFPNPSDGGHFTLQTTTRIGGHGLITVTGVDGRIHVQQNIEIPSGSHQFRFTPQLSSGIYLVRVVTPDGGATGKMMVK